MADRIAAEEGAENAPHKQRNKRGVICLYAEAKNVRSAAKLAHKMCREKKETRSFFVISIDFSIGYRYNSSEGGG